VLAEPRTNTLILRAPSPARLALAKGLIAQLDKPALTPGNINVVYLRNAEAVRLAPLLRAIIGSDPSFVPQQTGSGLSPAAGTSTPGTPGVGTSQQLTGGGTAPGIPQIASGAQTGGSGGLAGMIQADAATNSLIITAPEPLYRNIRTIIDKLDVRRAQVVIESLIAEVSADRAAEFGIQWQTLGSNINDGGTNVFGGTNFGTTGQNIIGASQNIGSLGQGLNVGIIRGTVNIPGVGEVLNLAFLARALETNADANILSTPTIQTLDNEEAKFLVGQNIPLITGSYASTGAGGAVGVNPFQTFERRDIGLQLRVKPQISEGGVVRLAIYQELSSIQNTLTAAQGGIITNKRSFESTVLVEDGNVVVLGGLIEDRTDNSKSSVPVLGDIPVLGHLFKFENRSRRKTNLLVFLRPYVVRDEATSSALALDRYDYIRGQVASSTRPDNFIFRDLQSRQIPEKPPVPPSMKRSQGAPAAPPPAAAPPAPATERAPEAGMGARGERIGPPAPIIDVAPTPAVPLPPPPPTSAPSPATSAPVPASNVVAASAPVAPPPEATSAVTPSPSAEPARPAMERAPPAVAEVQPAPPPAVAPAPPPASASTAPPAAALSSGSFAAQTGPAPTTGTQLLQVAAVTELPRGRELQRRLREAGFDAYWELVKTKKGDVVRVRVSVDPATQTVADTIAKLKAMGFDPIIVAP
jgi:general secretion pathway protein D